jgi:predicted metalloprotease
VRFRKKAKLDTSQVSDRRGAPKGALAVGGGGGVVAVLVVLGITLLGGDSTQVQQALDQISLGGGAGEEVSSDLSETCQTGADANQRDDCRIVGVVNSVQAAWSERLDGYREAPTVFFSGSTSTACGQATSAVGPFYCPADETVYIDLSFYDELRNRFGANGGPFAEAYVIAHEYGHHVEQLTGVLDRARSGDTGPASDDVRVELMADCYAGLWAGDAVETGYVEPLTEGDIADGISAAEAVGDDRIQEAATGRVSPESWTHGSSEMRARWFLRGYEQGSMDACDTFATDQL